jgi:transposase InsO family protein
VCLLVVRRQFGDEIPTLSEFAGQIGVSTDTLHRLYRWLLRPVFRLLRLRRPGPKVHQQEDAPQQNAVLRATNAFLKALLPRPIAELLKDSEKLRGVVVKLALHWSDLGVSREHFASLLGLPARTLRRWTHRFEKVGNKEGVPHSSRRPHHSPRKLPVEVQEALWKLRHAFPEIRTAELTRIFNQRFSDLLRRHGLEKISKKTAGRYLNGSRPSQEPHETSSKRGGYDYPPPLAMAWMDTTYFEVAGITIHIAGAIEASSRMALAAEAFVQDSALTTIEILERTLKKIPELSAVVRDRGTPYLNAQVTEFLTQRGVLPINAFPYFPIDKAALERWWDTLKSWMRHALLPFEENCKKHGIVPTKEQVVEVVRPALRIFVRAYNLLPQPYLEGKSPVERIEALLQNEGDPTLTLSTLRRMAMVREDKDDLLQELKDALQITVSIDRLRQDFIGISKDALRDALRACHKKLVIERDQTIKHPYLYILAVAKTAERRHQDEVDRCYRDKERSRRDAEIKIKTMEDLKREDEERAFRPEEVIHRDVEQWVENSRHPIKAVRRRAESRLSEVIESLKIKLGAAADAVIAQARTRVATLALSLPRPAEGVIPDLVADFDTIAAGGLCQRSPPTQKSPPPPTGQKGARSSSWNPLNNLVRNFLSTLRQPHVCRSDVSP